MIGTWVQAVVAAAAVVGLGLEIWMSRRHHREDLRASHMPLIIIDTFERGPVEGITAADVVWVTVTNAGPGTAQQLEIRGRVENVPTGDPLQWLSAIEPLRKTYRNFDEQFDIYLRSPGLGPGHWFRRPTNINDAEGAEPLTGRGVLLWHARYTDVFGKEFVTTGGNSPTAGAGTVVQTPFQGPNPEFG